MHPYAWPVGSSIGGFNGEYPHAAESSDAKAALTTAATAATIATAWARLAEAAALRSNSRPTTDCRKLSSGPHSTAQAASSSGVFCVASCAAETRPSDLSVIINLSTLPSPCTCGGGPRRWGCFALQGRDMNQRMTALERAFQLARSGQVLTVSEIKTSLGREGYSTNQLDGPSLKRQLTGLIRARRLDDIEAHRS
jgi:hypothetical protein